jgi:pyridoxine kinase
MTPLANFHRMTVISIQSQVAFGHVGNSAAVFPMQMHGIDVTAVPTTLLSNRPGYPSIRGRVLAKVRNPKLAYCCDPVLGDRDRGLFVQADIPPLVRDRLCPLADIITPNHFEFEWLCGAKAATSGQVIAAAQTLMALGPSTVIVTSAELEDTPVGEIETLAIERAGEGFRAWRVRTPKLPISPSGTGDLFAALFVAARVRGSATSDALGHAVSAIFAVLERTAIRGTVEMRIVESAELLVRPPRRFDPVAVSP